MDVGRLSWEVRKLCVAGKNGEPGEGVTVLIMLENEVEIYVVDRLCDE